MVFPNYKTENVSKTTNSSFPSKSFFKIEVRKESITLLVKLVIAENNVF